MGLAVVTIAVLLTISFTEVTLLAIHQSHPAFLFPYLLAIDIHAIKPWQWFQLATALITLTLWSMAYTQKIKFEASTALGEDFQWQALKPMQSMSRLRNLTTGINLLIAAVFTLLYWPEVYQYLPGYALDWLADFFDTRLPIRLGVL